MFLDRKAFSAIGGFDAEIFMYLEDIVLCWNLRRLGYGILQCEDAQVQHLGGRSHRSTWRRKRQYRASQQVMLRHLGMGPVARAAFRAVSLPSALLSLLRNPVRCDRPG
jgi:GT2 family glycosyltransferase